MFHLGEGIRNIPNLVIFELLSNNLGGQQNFWCVLQTGFLYGNWLVSIGLAQGIKERSLKLAPLYVPQPQISFFFFVEELSDIVDEF